MDKGARFHRCDFQVHSPRDPGWRGNRPAPTDAGRAAWADALVAACRAKGIDAISITDHHDTVMLRFVREATERELGEDGQLLPRDKRLVFFPGMELTLSLPCQCLLLFDADIPLEHLEQLPGILGYQPAPAADEKARSAIQLTQVTNPNDVIERLEALSYLRGRFIVLPHVSEQGHQTLLRRGFHEHYKAFTGVGGYTDGEIPPVGTGARTIIDGRDPAYGNKPLGVFQTSDARSADFSTLGRATTWVKWSSPTAEALRQSCLARRSRLTQTEPKLPNVRLLRVEVSSSVFLGRLNVFLNPQYNALIGGRGTGKSTLLEYMRWALAAPRTAASSGELPQYEQRNQALIEATLQSVQGQVRVWATVNGVEHVVERRTTPPSMSVKIAGDDFRPTTEGEVQRLIPVEAYSQKQLSSIGATKGDVLRFLLAPVGREVRQVEDELRSADDGVRAAFTGLQSMNSTRRERAIVASERDSFTKQRDAQRGEIKGLNEEDAKILRAGEKYADENKLVEEWTNRLASATAKLDSLSHDLRDLSAPSADLPNFRLLADAHQELNEGFARLREQLQSTRDDEAKFSERMQALGTKHKALIAEARVRYTAALQRSKGHQTAIQEIERLNTQIGEREARLTVLDAELEKLAGAEAEFEQAQRRWREVLDKRASLTKGRCDQVVTHSGGEVKGIFRPCSDAHGSLDVLREAARGSWLRGEKLETLGKNIAESPSPIEEWLRLMDELRALIGHKDESSELPHVPLLRAASMTDKELRGLAAKMEEETWLRIRLSAPNDVVDFEYRTREGSYIPFHVASAGQRATALMRLLLAQAGGPLIIDQPEDDLDNRVIHEIAETLGTAKQNRQLVFASHNANLVVNGDADLICHFDYKVSGEQTAGEIAAEGAIDDTSVRDAVTTVMEGGRNAFVLRRDKYGF